MWRSKAVVKKRKPPCQHPWRALRFPPLKNQKLGNSLSARCNKCSRWLKLDLREPISLEAWNKALKAAYSAEAIESLINQDVPFLKSFRV